jgi:predicted DNA-binding protein (MmcQ/YjbR family)
MIRSIASKYPEAEKAFLFGDHEVFRVRKKVFVWLGDGDQGTYVSVKLKDTQQVALMLPFVKPAEYGMAKWGWIAADIPKGKFSVELVRQWLDESYRHTAPKKLLKILDGDEGAVAPKAGRAKRGAPSPTAKGRSRSHSTGR